ncbi:MAG: hypothetical protein IPI73_09735 [Betaproteobacteria bacterium]|nr:hypothetical protein [Betaproteobacteria bacterium]
MSAGESIRLALPARRAACALDGVLAHIQAHLGRPLPLAGLAALAGLSVWRFATVFRQRVGVSPHRYIRVQRVRRARAAGAPACRRRRCGQRSRVLRPRATRRAASSAIAA